MPEVLYLFEDAVMDSPEPHDVNSGNGIPTWLPMLLTAEPSLQLLLWQFYHYSSISTVYSVGQKQLCMLNGDV